MAKQVQWLSDKEWARHCQSKIYTGLSTHRAKGDVTVVAEESAVGTPTFAPKIGYTQFL